MDPGEPVNRNVFALSHREKRRLRIDDLPADLGEAMRHLRKDRVVRAAIGEHVYAHLTEAQAAAWREYSATVHPWECDRYLGQY